jgi:DNA-binding transcriptional regulator GbsR (MarR family)
VSTPHPTSEFVQQAAGDMVAQGFPRMPAYVLMALTGSDEGRLTAAELSQQLGVSPAAVSTAIGYLTRIGFVRTQTVPGTRRHVYVVPDGWYTVTLTEPRYRGLAMQVRAAAEKLGSGPARERVEKMASFYEFLDERMPGLLEEWNARNAREPAP